MTDIIVSVINWMATVVGTLLPDLSLDSGHLASIVDGLEVVIEFMSQVNFLIPLPTILLVISIVYGFRLIKFSIFLINWVIRRIADLIP
ncbi:MAG: hypothetical protein KH230_09465 [Enterocloster asparagiformis]|nr:hypothetical protein [Enterocloster asparagiformis]